MASRSRFVLALAGAMSLVAGAAAAWQPVKLDEVHSRVGFTASTLLFDVDGHFGRYDLALEGDPAQPAQAKVKLVIDAASIDTDNAKRDTHLASADFLDVAKYPTIVFESESIVQSGTTLQVTGTLDLHGHKKKLTIPFKRVQGRNGAGLDTTAYKGKLTIDRSAFAVGAGSVAAKISLEDEVGLDLLIVTFP